MTKRSPPAGAIQSKRGHRCIVTDGPESKQPGPLGPGRNMSQPRNPPLSRQPLQLRKQTAFYIWAELLEWAAWGGISNERAAMLSERPTPLPGPGTPGGEGHPPFLPRARLEPEGGHQGRLHSSPSSDLCPAEVTSKMASPALSTVCETGSRDGRPRGKSPITGPTGWLPTPWGAQAS